MTFHIMDPFSSHFDNGAEKNAKPNYTGCYGPHRTASGAEFSDMRPLGSRLRPNKKYTFAVESANTKTEPPFDKIPSFKHRPVMWKNETDGDIMLVRKSSDCAPSPDESFIFSTPTDKRKNAPVSSEEEKSEPMTIDIFDMSTISDGFDAFDKSSGAIRPNGAPISKLEDSIMKANDEDLYYYSNLITHILELRGIDVEDHVLNPDILLKTNDTKFIKSFGSSAVATASLYWPTVNRNTELLDYMIRSGNRRFQTGIETAVLMNDIPLIHYFATKMKTGELRDHLLKLLFLAEKIKDGASRGESTIAYLKHLSKCIDENPSRSNFTFRI